MTWTDSIERPRIESQVRCLEGKRKIIFVIGTRERTVSSLWARLTDSGVTVCVEEWARNSSSVKAPGT